jgi:hypothetical protein
MMRLKFFAIPVTVFLFSALSASAYQLSLKDHTGDLHSYRIVSMANSSLTTHGKTFLIKSNIAIQSYEKVLEAHENEASKKTTYTNGKITATVSTADGRKQTTSRAIPDLSVTYIQRSDGATSDENSTVSDGKQKPDFIDGLDLIDDMMFSTGITLPTNEVKIGDTWNGTHEFETENQFRVTANIEYKLAGTKTVNGKTYLLITSDCSCDIPGITINPPAEAANAQPVILCLKISGKTTILFDEAAGICQDTNSSFLFSRNVSDQDGNMLGSRSMKLENRTVCVK